MEATTVTEEVPGQAAAASEGAALWRSRKGLWAVLAVLLALPVGFVASASAGAGSEVLWANEVLRNEQSIRSAGGEFHFVMQGDGNGVIYQSVPGGRRAIWATNTAGRPGSHIVMQGDGNLVIYQAVSGGHRAIWASHTAGRPGTNLVMQGDGNLVLYQPAPGGRRAVWASNTARASTPVPTPAPSSGPRLPVPRSSTTLHHLTKKHHTYPAADLPVPSGTPVYAVQGGSVRAAGWMGSCGYGVRVVNGNTEWTYCHGNGAIHVRAGQSVSAGQELMKSGNTGNSSGPHLHLQVKINGRLRCPQPAIAAAWQGTSYDFQRMPSSGCSY